MKAPKLVLISAILALSVAPLAAQAGSDYEAVKKAAVIEIDKAKAAGFEWRDSRKLLKKADEAAKKGDMKKALKLANMARAQGIAAVAQAESQKNAGPHY